MIKKRVLINGSMIDDRPSGVGKYALAVISQLLKSANENIEFTLITPPNSFVEDFDVKKIFISPKMKTSNKGKLGGVYRLLWNLLVYPFYLKNYDLGYSPTSHGTLFSSKQIITVHDLIALHYPKQHRLQYYYFKLFVPMWLKYAKKVIAISHQTKSDIITFFNCEAKKVEVIHNGFDNKEAKKMGAHEYIKSKFGFNNYILAIGAAYPHKNIATLIKAIPCLDKEVQDKFNLVICGSKTKHTQFLEQLVVELELSNKIIFTGYVNEEDLNNLYSAADLFVFPSLYEGFGFPPMEAIIRECPVVLSDIPVFHEIYEDTVLYFEARNQADLASQITKALSTFDHSEIMNKGLERIKLYSWEKCGTEILAQIEESYLPN